MGQQEVKYYFEQALSRPGHNLMTAATSGDSYRSATLHCTGTAHPYDVEEGRADSTCRWLGPNIKPGRWHDKQLREAFEAHVADVEANGPIVHGAPGAGRCRCYECRHGQTYDEMKATDQPATGSETNPSGDHHADS